AGVAMTVAGVVPWSRSTLNQGSPEVVTVKGIWSPLLLMGMGALLFGGTLGPAERKAQHTCETRSGAALTVSETWRVVDWTGKPVSPGGSTGVRVTVPEYVPGARPVRF